MWRTQSSKTLLIVLMFQKLPFYTYLKSFVVIFLWYILLWLNKIFFVSWIRFFHELFTLGAFNFGATFILMKDLRQVFFVGVFLRFPMKNNTQIRNYETRNTLWSLYPTGVTGFPNWNYCRSYCCKNEFMIDCNNTNNSSKFFFFSAFVLQIFKKSKTFLHF